MKLTATIAFACALLSIPAFLRDQYYLGLFILLFINLILTISLYPVVRMGQMSMGHAAFMAIGGYTSALLVTRAGFPFWNSLLASGLMAAVVGTAVGYPTLRIKGLFFVVITFGINEIVRLFAVFGPSTLGGVVGISSIPPPDTIALPGLPVIDFASRVHWYYLTFILLSLTLLILLIMDRSRLGRTYRAIAQNDLLAESIGINLMAYKVAVFTICCFFAGISGALYVHYFSVVSPEQFEIWKTIYALIYIQVGGLANIAGPVVGATVLITISEVFRFAQEYQPLIFGAILLLVVIFLPTGIISLPSMLRRKLSRRSLLQLFGRLARRDKLS